MTYTDHPEWAALLRAVAAAPDDDTPRLVAADWLEENGEADRARFVRLQVELARLEACGLGTTADAELLRRKEKAYLGPASYYGPLWAAEACPQLVRVTFREHAPNPLTAMHVAGADRLVFRRGFVEAVNCPALDWLHHGRTVRDRQPVRDLRLTDCDRPTRDRWVALVPALAGLRRVTLDADPGRLVEWLRPYLPGTEVAARPPR